MTQTLTIKLRLRDKHSSELSRMARAVNFVWNYCNETQQKAARSGRKWLNWLDLQKLTAGSSSELNLHAHTIQQICQAYDHSRRVNKRPWLRWRSKKSLGWVPFNGPRIKFDGKYFIFRKIKYRPMHIHPGLVSGMKLGAGSFNQDARGRWYINVPIQVECAEKSNDRSVGIDLGLKELATLSTGEKITPPRFYRSSEHKLAIVQRARKTKRARAIHAKICSRRRDFLHKASAFIAEKFGLIVVGDVAPKKLAQTRMAKSIHDAGWSDFKSMIAYKAMRHGARYLEVSERMTTQVCSTCGSLPPSRPKGIADLGIRGWSCDDCGTVHDRDVNAAINILRRGQATLVEGVAI